MPRHYLPKVNKWVSLAACLPVALSAGLAYSFAVWSPSLQEAYGLDQSQLELVGACHNLGGYSSFLSGVVYDALERRHHVGPRASLAAGAAANLAGFLGLWAAATLRFRARLWQLCALAVLAANGGTWLDTAALATSLRNFPAHRGLVVGLVKAAVGLSASLYASAYTGFLQPRADRFLLALALAPSAVALLALPLVNCVPFTQRCEAEGAPGATQARLMFGVKAVAALALGLTAVAAVNGTRDLAAPTRAALAAAAAALVVPLLLLPRGTGGLFAERADVGHGQGAGEQEEGCGGAGGGGSGGGGGDGDETEALLPAPPPAQRAHAVPGVGFGVAQALKLLDFWLLAGICGVGIGCALSTLNNLAPLVQSLGGPREARSVLVSLFGAASCGGRLAFGALPEAALRRRGTPRPAFVLGAGAATAATFASLAYAPMRGLFPLAAAAGLAFGAHWSLLPSLASELFGLGSFASIYTLLQLPPALVIYGVGAQLVPRLYQAAGRRHGDPGSTCLGPDCFRLAFLVMAALAAWATALSAWLLVRTRSRYRRLADALRAPH